MTLSQQVDLVKSVSETVVSSYNPAHNVIIVKSVGKSAANVLTQSHSAVAVKINPASSILTLSQAVTITRTTGASNHLDLGQALDVNTISNVSAGNYWQYFQTLSLTKRLNIAVGNVQSLSQTVIAPSVKGASNLLTLTQTVSVTKSHPAKNVLNITQTVSVAIVKDIKVVNQFAITQTMNRTLTKSYHVSNAIGFNQTIKHWKVFDLSVGNALVLTQDIVRERFLRTITSALSLSQSVTVQKVISVSASSVLSLNQVVVRAGVRHFAASNVLSFLNSREVYFPIGNIGTITVPNLLVTNIHTLRNGGPPIFGPGNFIAIPQSPIIVPPYCTLQVPQRTITLPAPEFNDNEAYSGIFTIRRSMTGGTITYPRRLNTYKFKYEFDIGGRKALELEDYILNYNSQIHTLTNWKGEIWYVYITNNPMELVTKSRYSNGRGDSYDDREKIAITLEFEGTRIN